MFCNLNLQTIFYNLIYCKLYYVPFETVENNQLDFVMVIKKAFLYIRLCWWFPKPQHLIQLGEELNVAHQSAVSICDTMRSRKVLRFWVCALHDKLSSLKMHNPTGVEIIIIVLHLILKSVTANCIMCTGLLTGFHQDVHLYFNWNGYAGKPLYCKSPNAFPWTH